MAQRIKRPISTSGSIAHVPLTKGYVAVIDASDVPLIESVNWYAHGKGRCVYAFARIDYKLVPMHRVILGMPDSDCVDHIDADTLNNRRANIRPATKGQNSMNRPVQSNNPSGFKGVTFDKERQKWRAYIKRDGIRKALGRFDTAEQAHAAYAAACEIYHGEFGRSS
jgi:hypothetical protein